MRESEKFWEAVVGRVVQEDSGEPLEGVRVRCYDKDILKDDHLGESVTGPDGKFRFEFTQEQYAGGLMGGEGRPDIYLKLDHPDGREAETEIHYEMQGDFEKTDDKAKGGPDGEIEVMDLGDVNFP